MASMISINGGEYVPLSSLTPEEKAACWAIIAERLGQVITDYVKQHPEQYDVVKKALLDSGGRIIEETRQTKP